MTNLIVPLTPEEARVVRALFPATPEGELAIRMVRALDRVSLAAPSTFTLVVTVNFEDGEPALYDLATDAEGLGSVGASAWALAESRANGRVVVSVVIVATRGGE